MLAHLSHWILFAALGQAPPEAALLKAAPADVDVAIRTRGLEATRDDLLAMLKAMNPEWGNMAEGMLAGPLAQLREHHGAHACQVAVHRAAPAAASRWRRRRTSAFRRPDAVGRLQGRDQGAFRR